MIEIKGMRWTARRKAELVEGVARGIITQEELAALEISLEELAHWQRLYAVSGTGALRSTRLQRYRDATLREKDARGAPRLGQKKSHVREESC